METGNHMAKHTLQHGIDHLESLIDLLANFRACENNLATDEDEEHNLGLDHAVDETGKQLGLVGAEVVMLGSKTLQTDGELDVARTHNVLDLEVGELGVEAELLNDTGILAGSKLGVIFRLGASDDHLARRKDQSGGLGLTDTHDNSGETLGVVLQHVRPGLAKLLTTRSWSKVAQKSCLPRPDRNTYLSIASVQRNCLQVQTAVKIDSRDNVPLEVSLQFICKAMQRCSY